MISWCHNLIERLWQLDVIPFRKEKMVVRSHEDQYAMNLLETKTQRLEVDGVHRCATPRLRKLGEPKLNSSTHSVMAHLRTTQKRGYKLSSEHRTLSNVRSCASSERVNLLNVR